MSIDNLDLSDLINLASSIEEDSDILRERIGEIVKNESLTRDVNFELAQLAMRAVTVRRTLELALALTGQKDAVAS